MTPATLTLDLGLELDRAAGRGERRGVDRGKRRAPRDGAGEVPRDRADAAPRALAPASAQPARGGPLLDDVISGAWRGLSAHRSVTCPVCRGSMAPRYGSGVQPVGGRCRRCGSTLG